jgi:hypothetical protein
MKKIRILKVAFSPEIKASEIPAFRGAVVAKIGREHILFHNHTSDSGFRYSYPLIQYKRMGKKAALICIKEGVDEIHRFFEQADWTLNLNGSRKEMKIDRLNVNQFTMNVWDKDFHYSLYNWIALNSENFEKYRQSESLADKLLFLENILTANILSFAKGIGWELEKQITVNITDLLHTKKLRLKGQSVLGFDIEFKTNAFLPNHIGLGKSVSIGFGTVKELRNKKK